MGWIRVSRIEASPVRGELGFWLGEAYHGHGYMTEGAVVAVAAAFHHLNLDAIEGGAQPDNAASFAVMRRLGMEPAGERVVWASARGRDELCIFYSVTRDRFSRQVHSLQRP